MRGDRTVQSPEEIWKRYDAMEVRLTAPLSERMLDLAGLRPGMRVLDLASGRGEPAIRAAHRVGPRGAVLGVDVSSSMLAMARERAAREGVGNLELRVEDVCALEGVAPASFDAALSRWGLMYLDAPVEALARARRALRPAAPLVAAVFVEPARAVWYTLPRRLLERYRALPTLDPAAPGPLRYADPELLTQDLAHAGLQTRQVEDLVVPLMEAETAADLVAWVRAFGLEGLLADLPEPSQRAWEADLAREAERFREADGFVRLGAVTRIAVATA